MEDKKRVSRAPRGYRIVLWADGFYHVYFGGECIDEVLSRWAGIAVCKKTQSRPTRRAVDAGDSLR